MRLTVGSGDDAGRSAVEMTRPVAKPTSPAECAAGLRLRRGLRRRRAKMHRVLPGQRGCRYASLRVGVAGLGGGGSSLGLASGKSESECVALVRTAMDLGVSFLDTAQNYGTEAIVGNAVNAVDRDQVGVR